MYKLLTYYNSLLILLACICFPSAAFSIAYEETLDEEHRTLSHWSIPAVLLSIENAYPDPDDKNLILLRVRVIEVYRKGSISLKTKDYDAVWRTYRKRAETYKALSSMAMTEPTGDELLESLAGTKLICFTGQSLPTLTLYAYDCFSYNERSGTIAREKIKKKPLSIYFYEYSKAATLIFPLLGFISVILLPKTGILIAALTFPSFIYYNAHVSAGTARYDLMLAYPAMIFAAFVIIFGSIRLLHQMVKMEQKEKADARKQERSNSD